MSKPTVIYTGSNGFPYGSAQIQRQIQLSKSLLEVDFNVVVINRKGVVKKEIATREKLKRKGVYQGITYYYASLFPHKSKSFLIRNLLKCLGLVGELYLLFNLKLVSRGDIMFCNTTNLKTLKYY